MSVCCAEGPGLIAWTPGSFHNPEEIPGLAHFLEHLLFMGTEKYPHENEYGRFLNEHGGHSNAFTAEEHTNYFFEVNHDHLEGALDRFAQFFISPLFLESTTEREMQAVDSEHAKNVLQDNWRLNMLERSLANPEHPFHKFGTGNLETLGTVPKARGIDLRAVLLDFHARWYSANLMSLVVLGKEPLDELQAYVERMFAPIVNKAAPRPSWPGLPWAPGSGPLFTRARTVRDKQTLYLTWLCPSDEFHDHVKPQKYYAHLVGHEGHGSILALLKKKHWATTLSAGCNDDATGYSFFEVTVELSQAGLKHYTEVVQIVFDYMAMIVAGGPHRRIFDESAQLSQLGFRFREQDHPSTFAYKTARNLHRYPAEFVLSGPHVQEHYDEAVLQAYGAALTSTNARVILATKDDPAYTGTWLKEPWYGSEYYTGALGAVMAGARPGAHAQELFLPPENAFIPTTFSVLVKPASVVPLKAPRLAVDDDGIKVWHKIDDTFETPKAAIHILFRSSLATRSVEDAVGLQLYTELLKHRLTPTVYPAELAGLHYEFSVLNEGLELKVCGFYDKLGLLLETILAEMRAAAGARETHGEAGADEQTYLMLREHYAKHLANLEHEQPYWHCSYITSGLLQQQAWWYWQRLAVLEKIGVGAVMAAGRALLEDCFIEALVHGSIADVAPIAAFIRSCTAFQAAPTQSTQACLAIECALTYGLPKQLADPNSAIEVFYATAQLSDTHGLALTDLFIQAFEEPFFDTLRTKEQLGYIVYCGRREKYGQAGIRFVIQSTKGDPAFLAGRIDAFLQSVPGLLEAMADDTFDSLVQALCAKLVQKKTRLNQEAAWYWEQIVASTFDFGRLELEAHLLPKAVRGRACLLAFVREKLLGPARSILAVQAWPRSLTMPGGTGVPPRLPAQ